MVPLCRSILSCRLIGVSDQERTRKPFVAFRVFRGPNVSGLALDLCSFLWYTECNVPAAQRLSSVCGKKLVTGALKMPVPQRRRTQYRINLSFADYIKVVFDRTGKEVVQFAVQYLADIEGEWPYRAF
jgi:hypothetical protein